MCCFFYHTVGEFVDPKEYFKVSEYPSFLKVSDGAISSTAQPHPLFTRVAPSTSTMETTLPRLVETQGAETEVDLVCTEQSEMDTGMSTTSAVGGVTSAFASIESREIVTPSLYANPVVGKAVASSTPAAARSLTFTHPSGPEAQTGLSVEPGHRGTVYDKELYRYVMFQTCLV